MNTLQGIVMKAKKYGEMIIFLSEVYPQKFPIPTISNFDGIHQKDLLFS